eukprot:scaffold26303_cov14-Tisochrysis_lutea.AAC.1
MERYFLWQELLECMEIRDTEATSFVNRPDGIAQHKWAPRGKFLYEVKALGMDGDWRHSSHFLSAQAGRCSAQGKRAFRCLLVNKDNQMSVR